MGEAESGQSVTVEPVSIEHDGNGNLTSVTNTDSGNSRSLTYDADNRLLEIEEAGLRVRYLYDARGRRVVKHILEGNNQGITFFLHLGDQEIAEMDETGKVLRYYVPGAGVDQRVAMIDNFTTLCDGNFASQQAACFHYYHADRLGNVIAIQHQGRATDLYRYSPFGLEEPMTESGQPFRYTGQRYDPESGYFYYKARYYSPELGRFLQTDPVGYADQWNLYAYVTNDPLNLTDPTGMMEEESRLGEVRVICEEHSSRCGAQSDNVNLVLRLFSGKNNIQATDPITEKEFSDAAKRSWERQKEKSTQCAAEVLGAQTGAGAAIAYSDVNNIPTRAKPTGATKGTSLSSVASRAAFKDHRLPRRVWAPTLKNPMARSSRTGTVVGRLAPGLGWAALGKDAVDFYECMEDNTSSD